MDKILSEEPAWASTLVGTHAKFKYEDGRWYWGVIDGYSAAFGKLHVCLSDNDRKWHAVDVRLAEHTPCVMLPLLGHTLEPRVLEARGRGAAGRWARCCCSVGCCNSTT